MECKERIASFLRQDFHSIRKWHCDQEKMLRNWFLSLVTKQLMQSKSLNPTKPVREMEKRIKGDNPGNESIANSDTFRAEHNQRRKERARVRYRSIDSGKETFSLTFPCNDLSVFTGPYSQ